MIGKTRGMAFEATMALLLIVLATALCLAVAGGPHRAAQGTDYTGKAELVLEILGRVGTAIQANHSAATYSVRVLYSNNSTIERGADYYLGIMVSEVGYFGSTGAAPEEITDGSVIGIDYYNYSVYDYLGWYDPRDLYSFDGSTILVWISADPHDKNAWDNAWRDRIKVLSPGRSSAYSIF